MKTSVNAWYVRWFMWNCRVLENVFPNKIMYYENGTNLCQFFRTLLFGTIAAVWSIAVYVYIATVALIMPFVLFGAMPVISTLAIVIAAVSLFIGSIVLVMYTAERSSDASSWITEKTMGTSEHPTFLAVIVNYIVGVKKKFCPTITFVKENTDA